jgi:putative NADPH-quinone reductase
MENRFLIVNGHPDPSGRRYCAALCEAYAAGVRSRGWSAERIDVGAILTQTSMRSQEPSGLPLLTAEYAVNKIREADHLAIIFPLWLGAAPHTLQLLFDSVARVTNLRQAPVAADLVVTMDMPALLYRTHIDPHRKSAATRNPFYLQGSRSDHSTLIGSVNVMAQTERERWLAEVQAIAGRAVDRDVAARRPSVLGWRVPLSLPVWLKQRTSHREPRLASRH